MHESDVRALAAGIEQLTLWMRRNVKQEVSASTITALIRLEAEGPLRVSELAAREAVSQPGITVLVNRLSEAGYAERIPDPTDRRASLVRITEAGRTVLAERLDGRAELLRVALVELSDEDQRLIAAALPAIERLVAIQPDADRTSR